MEDSYYDNPKSLDATKAKIVNRPMSAAMFSPTLEIPAKACLNVDDQKRRAKVELVKVTSFDASKGISLANQMGLADSEGELYTEMKSAPVQVSKQEEEEDQECTYDIISADYTKKDISMDDSDSVPPMISKEIFSTNIPKESRRHSAPKLMEIYSRPRKVMKKCKSLPASKIGVELPSPPAEDKDNSDVSIYNIIDEVQKSKSQSEAANTNDNCIESDKKVEEQTQNTPPMPLTSSGSKPVLFQEKSQYHRSNGRNRKGCVIVSCIYSITALVIGAMIGCIAFGFLELRQLRLEINTLKPQSPISSGEGSEQDDHSGLMQLISSNAKQIGNLSNQTMQLHRDISLLQSATIRLFESLGEMGQYSTLPIPECSSLPPSSPSGYYWVRNNAGASVRMYCAFNFSCGSGISGTWRRVAKLNMTNSSHRCPSGFRERTDSNIRTCVSSSISSGCYPVVYSSGGIDYTHVCGRIIGYQVGNTNAYPNQGLSINSNYVDGISLTHGNPRQHIWTFAAARDAAPIDLESKCPCIYNGTSLPPSFVGDDYFCDTASRNETISAGRFFSNDTLWDGEGCAPLNNCCSFNAPPWFYRQFEPTTDDIEMRVCKDETSTFEDIAIKVIEIYVQ